MQSIAYREQYNLNSITLIPSNLYGEYDNFNLEESHVIPALVRKIHNAIKKKRKIIEVWGTGKPKREIMHVDDLADAIVYFMNKKTKESLINIGSGYERTINQYAKILINISGKKIRIKNLNKNLNGVRKKLLNSNLARKYGWVSKENILQKLKETFESYKE